MWLTNEMKRGIDAVEAEGQASNTDNVYQPAAANVRGKQLNAKMTDNDKV